ncbi:MAG: HDOD domain-containing protein [Opitutales bacterium]|nr:HDOD domain-containing protein [Opitutales bacterium]MBT5167591.1 HDOD domain-containing protein [Opitutales bacterium]MBT5813210.1 HDOD domain-containing protein [Opitutales bacterium]MBT6380858.1 HDOD domain-containing protein [Opitutales bacterium]MBT6770395.1 HDOD domain-containing protein [Opitutales bacterium]
MQSEPAIVTGVLRLSNSGANSPPSPVTDLGDAISMLGHQRNLSYRKPSLQRRIP